MQSSRYAHARQMKRARACTRKLKTQLGRVIREVERQAAEPSMKLDKLLQTAHRIYAQQKHDKNKIYSVHETEVQCIAKGKAGKQYEFGNKVSVAVSSRGGWFVAAKSFQKLIRAFWRIFLLCLMNTCNGLLTLQGPQARNTQLQSA